MPTNDEMADALLRYPNKGDVDFARQQDFSYGEPWADYFNSKAFNLMTNPPGDVSLSGPFQTKNVNPSTSRLPFGETADVYAKAALASKRSALAALGFDPANAVMDVTRDPTKVNILGAYTPSLDTTYVNARSPSTLVHESIHRGIEKLHDSPFWKPEFDDFHRKNNEHVVRWLMQSKMGDPEHPEGAAISPKLEAASLFNTPYFIPSIKRREALTSMEAAAAQLLAAQRPRGPR